MARLTTVPFRWRNKEFTAMVTLKPTENDVHYTIVFDHADLLAYIPDGVLKFYGTDGASLLDEYKGTEAREIINAVVKELLVKYSYRKEKTIHAISQL